MGDTRDSRRSILKMLMLALLIVPLKPFLTMIRDRMAYLLQSRQPAVLPLDLPEGISFHNEVIAFRADENTYKMVSARCTHLGCIVDRMEKNELVCPCHGSRYSLEGKVMTGPATQDLTPLKHTIDPENGKIIVEPPA